MESNTRSDSIVIITKLLDKQKRVIIISLLLDGKGNIKIRDIDNVIKKGPRVQFPNVLHT